MFAYQQQSRSGPPQGPAKLAGQLASTRGKMDVWLPNPIASFLTANKQTWLITIALAVVGFGSPLILAQDIPQNRIPNDAAIVNSSSAIPLALEEQAYSPPGITVPASAFSSKNPVPLAPFWDHGLRLVSPDGNFNLHIGGNVQWDTVWLNGSDSVLGAPSSNSTSTTNSGSSNLRRARAKFDGTLYHRFDYSMEFDLANAVNENKGSEPPTQDNVTGSPFPCNIWLQMRDVPWFNRVRIGNQVKPIGMTNNTYQGFLPFLERADNMDAFYGPFDEGFDPGISSINWNESESMTLRYGIFRPLKNAFGIAINGYTVAGRATAIPIYENDGSQLLHFGFGASQGSLVADEFRIRARPALRNGPGYAIPVIADTGTLPGDSQVLLGPELAAVLGSLTLQSEWTGQYIHNMESPAGVPQGTGFFHGGYLQALYFLTGEHQSYEKKEGVFGRVVPHRSVGLRPGCGGIGAWQIGCRFSYLDLNNSNIRGGVLRDMTLGLNWFLNPNMKIQSNYLLTHRDAQQDIGSGWFNGIGVRAAFDF